MASREERQRQASSGSNARDAAAANQRQAAGQPPDSPRDFGLRGQGNGPVRVSIVEGQQQFFDQLKGIFGYADATNSAQKTGRPADGDTAMESSKAIAEAARQMTNEVKNLAQLMRDTQTQIGDRHQSMSNFIRTMQAHNETQMSQLMTTLMSGGLGQGGGGGGGHGGGGDGHGGGGGHQPIGWRPDGGYVSYGDLQSRMRAKAANFVENNYGVSSLPKHASEGTIAGAAARSELAGNFARFGAMGALRRAPYVGMAIAGAEGVNNAAEWLTNQRAANNRYQSIYAGSNVGGVGDILGGFFSGGSTDSRSGFANRAAEEGYVLSNRFSAGGMDEANARAAFTGVSQLGFTGDQRDRNLSFISQNYKNLGMSADESMQYNQLAAKYGQTNFDSLAQSLQKVSQAAVKTSQSAEALRKTFVGNYQTALQGGAGASASTLAGAMTMMTANNRDLAGVSYGAGILTNPVLQYASASMIGMTPGQVQGQAAQGNVVPMMQSQQKLTDTMLNSAASTSVQNKLQQLMAAKGGPDKVQASGGAQYDIANELIQDNEWNTPAMAMAMQQAGVQGIDQSSTPQQVAEAYINWVSGKGGQAQINAAKGDTDVKSLGQGKSRAGYQQYLSKFNADISDASRNAAAAKGDVRTTLSATQKQQQTTISAYQDLQRQHGDNGLSDPAIEAAIERFGGDTSTMIRVQSKDGDKVVSLADAIKYYPDQITKGSVSVASTDANLNGKKLTEITGVKDTGIGQMPDSSKTQNFGQSADDWTKANPVKGADATGDNSGSGGGKVTISLSPEAARYFTATGSGNVNIDGAAAAGVPPQPGG